jgi:hypothetical protein
MNSQRQIETASGACKVLSEVNVHEDHTRNVMLICQDFGETISQVAQNEDVHAAEVLAHDHPFISFSVNRSVNLSRCRLDSLRRDSGPLAGVTNFIPELVCCGFSFDF